MKTYHSTFHGQILAKKNSKIISVNKATGRPFVRMNDRAKEQEAAMARQFSDDFTNQGMIEPLYDSVEVIMDIWNQDMRPRDLDNQISTILDGLVKAGVLQDDNQKYVSQIKGYYHGVDKEDPRAEITIYSAE